MKKNEMLVMVLTDLAAISKKLAADSDLPEDLRDHAGQFVAEFNFLLPFRGKGTASQRCAGEALLLRMAQFLPKVLEVDDVDRTFRRR